MKNEFVKLHDEMLDYENDILSDVEMLSELRNKIYDNKCKEYLKLVKPILIVIAVITLFTVMQ